MNEIVAVKLVPGENVKLALRPDEAAKALSVSLPFLKGEIRRGAINTVRKGRGARKAILIPIWALIDYLKTSEESGAAKSEA